MSAVQDVQNLEEDVGIRNYTILALAALAGLFLILLQRGFGLLSLLPVVIGLLGVGLNWRMAPVLVLVTVAILYIGLEPAGLTAKNGVTLRRTFRLSDWLLCTALLGYTAAMYRLLGLAQAIFPHDPERLRERHSSDTDVPAEPEKEAKPVRNPRLIDSWEIGWLVLALPIWALAAQLCWKWLPRSTPVALAEYQTQTRTWQGIVFAWILTLLLLLAATALWYLGQKRLTPAQARLQLQDILWRETRREQQRLAHWLAWCRLRRRRKEKS
jgi:hypothetical protein